MYLHAKTTTVCASSGSCFQEQCQAQLTLKIQSWLTRWFGATQIISPCLESKERMKYQSYFQKSLRWREMHMWPADRQPLCQLGNGFLFSTDTVFVPWAVCDSSSFAPELLRAAKGQWPEACALRKMFMYSCSSRKGLTEIHSNLSWKTRACHWERKHGKGDWVQIYCVFINLLGNTKINSVQRTSRAGRLCPGSSRVLVYSGEVFMIQAGIYYQAGCFEFPFFTLCLPCLLLWFQLSDGPYCLVWWLQNMSVLSNTSA